VKKIAVWKRYKANGNHERMDREGQGRKKIGARTLAGRGLGGGNK
jgi:hypothetical protein